MSGAAARTGDLKEKKRNNYIGKGVERVVIKNKQTTCKTKEEIRSIKSICTYIWKNKRVCK